MNKRIKLTIGIGLTVLLLVAVFTTAAFAQGPGGTFGRMMGGLGFGGMMGGQGQQNFGGMMSGQGFGGMMGGKSNSGMMARPDVRLAANPADAQPNTIDQAAEAAQQYLKNYNNADLKLAEVMEFDNNFYALVTEKSTGVGAYELLVNRYTGYVTPNTAPT